VTATENVEQSVGRRGEERRGGYGIEIVKG
jgi:hypothetical protein